MIHVCVCFFILGHSAWRVWCFCFMHVQIWRSWVSRVITRPIWKCLWRRLGTQTLVSSQHQVAETSISQPLSRQYHLWIDVCFACYKICLDKYTWYGKINIYIVGSKMCSIIIICLIKYEAVLKRKSQGSVNLMRNRKSSVFYFAESKWTNFYT